jgi:hypothetical protein
LTPSGSSGSSAASATSGSTSWSRRRRLDRGLEAQPVLGVVELEAALALAVLVELAFGRRTATTHLVEATGDRAHLVALPAADLEQLGVTTLDHVAVAVDQRGQALDRDERTLDGDTPLGGCGAGGGVGLEPLLGLAEAPLEERLALVEPRVAHLEFLTARPEHRGCGRRVGRAARRGPWRPRPRLPRRPRARARALSSSTMRARSRSIRSAASARLRSTCLELGARLTTLGLRTGQRLAARGEARVVLVEPTGELGLVLTGRLQLGPGGLRGLVAASELGLGDTEAFVRLVERGRGGPATGRADAPSRRSETVAVGGDHDVRAGVPSRCRGLGEVGGTDGTAEDHVEQPFDRGVRLRTCGRTGDRRPAAG